MISLQISLSGVDNPQEITLESVKDILVDKAPAESLEYIMNSVNALCNGEFDVVFDLSLVRGQGYYTGTVFEVESIDFKGAIAGGGRYDNLIGKFLGQQVSAVGFYRLRAYILYPYGTWHRPSKQGQQDSCYV